MSDTQNTDRNEDSMTLAQYNTLKTIQSVEDTNGRYLHHRCYDGRVVPGLITRGWAEKNADSTVMITAKGHRLLKAETAERRPVLSTEEKLARLGL